MDVSTSSSSTTSTTVVVPQNRRRSIMIRIATTRVAMIVMIFVGLAIYKLIDLSNQNLQSYTRTTAVSYYYWNKTNNTNNNNNNIPEKNNKSTNDNDNNDNKSRDVHDLLDDEDDDATVVGSTNQANNTAKKEDEAEDGTVTVSPQEDDENDDDNDNDFESTTTWKFRFERKRYKSGILGLCDKLDNEQYPWRRRQQDVPSNITMVYSECDLDKRIGNSLSDYFFNRIIAAHAGINFKLDTTSCSNKQHKMNHVYPLLGRPKPLDGITMVASGASSTFSWKEACSACIDDVYSSASYPHECRLQDVSALIPAMKRELRALARRVLEMNPTLINEIDDVAIHLRMLDILNHRTNDMGLLPFRAYLELIPSYVSSIGIVTAPFGSDDDASIIATGLQDFLKHRFPHATVTIRNSATDTIPIVYTRMIKARLATICTASTFSLHPTLAAEGTSILIPTLLYGSKHPNWVDTLPDKFDDIQVPNIRYVPSGNNLRNASLQLRKQNGVEISKMLSTITEEDYRIVEYDEFDERIRCTVRIC